MIIALQYILSLFFIYKILKTSGLDRFIWYLASITLVSTAFNFYNGIAITKGHIFFVFIFLTSLFFEGKLKLRYIKQCPLYIPLMIVFISYLCIGFFDERLNPLVGIYRGTYNYIQTYGSLFLGWLSIYDKKIEMPNITKKLTTIALIFTIYGIFTFLTKTNPVIDALGHADRFVFENANATFRSFLVSGFLLESGVYGLSCFLFLMFLWTFKPKRHKKQTTVMALLFVSIFLTGTRSIMIPAITGLIIYTLIIFNVKEKITSIIGGTLIIAFIFYFLPNSVGTYINEIFSAIIDVILPGGSGGADLGGSSIDARDMQITAAFTKYLPENLFFGHGFNYFQEVIIPFNNGVNDNELLGMESYLCFLGVEYGLVNIICIIIFFICAIVYTIKNRLVNLKLFAVLLSIIMTFIIYLITAYMGNSWLYAMPVIGVIIGFVELTKKNGVITNN